MEKIGFKTKNQVKRLKGLGISMEKLESPWKEDVIKPSKKTIQDIQAKFTSIDYLIAILLMQGSGCCSLLVLLLINARH